MNTSDKSFGQTECVNFLQNCFLKERTGKVQLGCGSYLVILILNTIKLPIRQCSIEILMNIYHVSWTGNTVVGKIHDSSLQTTCDSTSDFL